MKVSSPFGSRTRTRVLLALERHGQSYPRELARLLASPLSVVQKAVRSLELDALITGRMLGRTRLLELNPRYPALIQLRGFLARLARKNDGLESRAVGKRLRSHRAERSTEDRLPSAARPGRSRDEERREVGRDRWRVW